MSIERLFVEGGWFERLREAEQPPQPGTIGPYELVAEISRGGQGVVYRARQAGTNRPVALKRLLAGALATPIAHARFRREIEAASALNHPNIVTVFGVETIDAQPVLAMQWVDGVPIDAWAGQAKNGRRPLTEILDVFLGTCDAVRHAHQRGVLHRDLKPTNILVDADGQPHVLDFGLAKSIGPDDSGCATLTVTNEFLGTPAYASPEQVRADQANVDTRTDVYALGAILHQLITGRRPFDSCTSLPELLEAIRAQDVAPLSRLNPKAPRELDAIVRMALAKDPAQRYQSVDALGADVRRYLAGEPVVAQPRTSLYTLRKLVRRHRFGFGFAATVALLVIAFGIASAYQAMRLHKQRAAAERRFSEVRGLARTLLYDLHDAVAPLEGALPAREFIVSTGLSYLDALATESGDTELLLECADGYFRIASVQGNPNAANLGQTEAALASCEKGLAIVAALLDRHETDAAVQLHAAIGQHMLGNILTAAGRTGEAIVAYERALSLRAHAALSAEAVVDALPRTEHIRADLAGCYERADRFAEAEAQLALAADLIEQRLRDDPQDKEARLKLGNMLASLGHVRVQQADGAGAAAPLDEAICILHKAIEAEPTRENIQRSLVAARTARARAAAMRGDSNLAKDELTWVIEVHRHEIGADPDNVTAHHDLGAAHHFLGKLLDSEGDLEGALLQFEEMLRIRRQLADDDPASMMAKRGLAMGLDMTGAALRKLGRLDQALARHHSAKSLFEELAAADPDNPRQRRSVAISAYYLGQLYRDMAAKAEAREITDAQRWIAARDQFLHARRIMTQLNAAGLALPQEGDVLDMLSAAIADCERSLAEISIASP